MAKSANVNPVAVRIGADLHTQLKIEAAKRRMTISAVVTEYLEKAINKPKRGRPPRPPKPSDDELQPGLHWVWDKEFGDWFPEKIEE